MDYAAAGAFPAMDTEQPHTRIAPSQTTEDAAMATARLARMFASLFGSVSTSTEPNGTTTFVVATYRPGDDTIGEGDAYPNGGFGAVPASGEAIAALPKSTVVGEEGSQLRARGEAEECAVCLEGYEMGQTLRTMPCSHDFHEGCIFDWLRASRMCPLCRFKLPPDDTEESDSDEEDEAEQDQDDDYHSTC